MILDTVLQFLVHFVTVLQFLLSYNAPFLLVSFEKAHHKSSNNPLGGLLIFGPSGGEGVLIWEGGLLERGETYLKSFYRQRQNYTNVYELYIALYNEHY